MTRDELVDLIRQAAREKRTELDLSGNGITELPAEIGLLTHLKKLVAGMNLGQHGWHRNQITKLPPEIGQLENLQELCLGNNQITQLPPQIGQLVNLKALRLRANKLTQLPPQIGQLAKLKDLDIAANKLTQLPSQIGQLVNLEVLDVANNQLKQLPPEIGRLLKLQALHLDGNQFTQCPAQIGKLVNLTYLRLDGDLLTHLREQIVKLVNLRKLVIDGTRLSQLPSQVFQVISLRALFVNESKLTQLPPAIGQLVNLEELNLRENQLTQLPPAIGQLVNLEELNLRENQLTQLPPEIGQLVNLEELNLGENQVTQLPPQIGQLVNLKELNLEKNQLTQLPPQIGQLVNLHQLWLQENQITHLPPEIGQLVNLKDLNLMENQLTQLPRQIGQLVKLERLNVGFGNQLRQLPPQIGQLVKLETLWLQGNQITHLPPEIGQLVKLKSLWLIRNQITKLPPQIGILVNLQELGLDGNPLTSPPPEIVKQGTKAILAYLRAQQKQGQKRLWVSKMVVVGEGGVGKTSLLRMLDCGEFDDKEQSTHGMKAHKPLLVPHPTQEDVTMKLFAWDFGGQQIYHATHQFFLTDKALFVVVWNARTEYTQGRLGYWLDAVKARAPNSPILIVATHVDERSAVPPPLDEWKTTYNIVGYLEVSNKDGRGIPALRQKIAEIAAALQHMGAERPANWVSAASAVQKTFIKQKSDPNQSRDYCDLAELLEFLARHGVHGEEANVMLRWYHDIGGVLIYPDDPDLKDLVILNPWWVNQTISKVLDYADASLDQGVLTRAHVDVIWDDLPKLVRPKILRLMERFDLAYRIPDTDSSLVVPRLPPNPPDYRAVCDAIRQKPGCKELALRYEFSHIPAGIPTWFIARSHRFSMNMHWRNGALFTDAKRQHLGLVRADPEQRQMELIVRGPMPQDFFAVLKDGLALTLARYPGLEVRRSVPCPGRNGRPCAGQFDLDALHLRLEKGKESIECHRCGDDLSIPRLLFGWGAVGNDRLMQELLDRVTAGFQGQDAGFQRQDAGFQRQEDNHRELVALLQRRFLQVHQSVQGLAESHCPNVFTLRQLEQAKLKGVVTKKLELQLYCQAPGNWHPTASGRYVFSRPADWLRPLAPYLAGLVKVLRCVAPIAGAVVDDETAAQIRATADLSSALLGSSRESREAPEASTPTPAEGAALRQLRLLLDELDAKQTWGGLKNVLTPEGHWLWLCEECGRPYRC